MHNGDLTEVMSNTTITSEPTSDITTYPVPCPHCPSAPVSCTQLDLEPNRLVQKSWGFEPHRSVMTGLRVAWTRAVTSLSYHLHTNFTPLSHRFHTTLIPLLHHVETSFTPLSHHFYTTFTPSHTQPFSSHSPAIDLHTTYTSERGREGLHVGRRSRSSESKVVWNWNAAAQQKTTNT